MALKSPLWEASATSGIYKKKATLNCLFARFLLKSFSFCSTERESEKRHLCSKAQLNFYNAGPESIAWRLQQIPHGPNYSYQSKTNGQGIKLRVLNQSSMLSVKVKMSGYVTSLYFCCSHVACMIQKTSRVFCLGWWHDFLIRGHANSRTQRAMHHIPVHPPASPPAAVSTPVHLEQDN